MSRFWEIIEENNEKNLETLILFMEIIKMKKVFRCLIFVLVSLLLLLLNDYCSYSRRIGNTHFYLVESMAISKTGKSLAILCYKSEDNSGYYGGDTPGFPRYILWNDKYLISKNFDGNNPEIIEYVIISFNSINKHGEMKNVHRFQDKNTYYKYLKQIKLSEADMDKTDNHIAWWEILFPPH